MLCRPGQPGRIGRVIPTWRPLTESDAEALAELGNAAAAADGTGGATTAESVREMFTIPRFDAATDSTSAWDGDRLLAYGVAFNRENLVEGRSMAGMDGAVHPDHRRQGLGTEALTWAEERAAAIARRQHPGAPVRLRTSGGLADSPAQRLLEGRGYVPDNYFVTMQVELEHWVDPGAAMSGTVPDRDLLLGPTREAHNDAFRDHRNFSPISADAWEHWMGSSTVRRDLSRVVVGGGRVLAYVVAAEHEPGVLHVELVGTRREARGRGLARQVLLGSLRATLEAGYRISELEVDQTSPTGADQLYVSAGYVPVRVISRYLRDLE